MIFRGGARKGPSRWPLLGVLLGLFLAGCDAGSPTGAESFALIANLSVASGNAQVGRTGETLAQPIGVLAVDANGDPIRGTGLIFTITSGGGQVSQSSVETDASGQAQVFWTLGRGPEHELSVTPADPLSDAAAVTFTATNELVLLIRIVSGAGQEATRGQGLPDPIAVRLEDCYGQPIPSVELGFQVVRGGGSVAQPVVTSGADGTAQATWVMGAGPDNRLEVQVLHATYTSHPAIVEARTRLELNFQWIADLPFYDGFGMLVEHDNRILESDHLLVFSDASGDSAKIVMATRVEEDLAELLQDFEITSAEAVGIDPSDPSTKIHVYSAVNLGGGNTAFRDGFIHSGFDSDSYLYWGIHDPRFLNSVKHETLHVLNLLLLGGHRNGQPDWFTEGFAEEASDGGEPTIGTWDEVVAWSASELHINPISVRVFDRDLPPGAFWGDYYPMFHLAVEYLLAADGWGATYPDVRDMWADMAAGSSFDAAFESHIGLSVATFETAFYNFIRNWMNR